VVAGTRSELEVTVDPARLRALRTRSQPGAINMSVIVSTYEWPEALDAVLRALAAQSDAAFEVVVTDDGSSPSTEATVVRWKCEFGARLSYVWQPDEGYQLARARNLGAAAASGAYLVFMDGDCLPRRHFVASIRRALLPGWFLAGTRLQLSARLSQAVLRERTPIERWSSLTLALRARRCLSDWRYLTPRDRRRPWRPRLPDFVPRGKAYGFCIAVARADFEAVDGFDVRFVGWGDEDVDLAVRLRRHGLRCGYAGPRSALLHLWHPSRIPAERATWWLLQETIASDRVEAIEGVRSLRPNTSP
jgi:GT2 family glycosyltransferase